MEWPVKYCLNAEAEIASAMNPQLRLIEVKKAGRGVPQDDMLAYMWFDIAVKQGREGALEFRKSIAARIHPELIPEAQALADAWLLEFR